MGRSSANAKVPQKNSTECSAWFGSATCDYLAKVQPNFGKNLALFVAVPLWRLALPADVNLKSLYLLLVTNIPVGLQLTCCTLQISS